MKVAAVWSMSLMLFAVMGVGVAPAFAQSPEEEILVTARKREETSIAVPVVLTVVGAKELERRGISSIDGVARAVPLLMSGESGGSAQGGSLTFRGIGGADGNPFADQAVSFNVDGMSISRTGVRRLASMDLGQIEVLKGPQALFFGKNSPAGVISLRTADPTPHFEAKVSAGYDFGGREWRTEGYISGPVTDTVGVRLAAYGSKVNGWLDNITPANQPLANPREHGPNSTEYALRGTIKYDSRSGNFSARLKLSGDHMNSGGAIWNSQLINCPYGTPQLGNADECKANSKTTRGALGPNFATVDPLYDSSGSTYLNTRQELASLEMNYDFTDHIKLTSVTGYYNYRSDWRDTFNLTYTPASLLVSTPSFDDREVSQEVRVTSSFDKPLNFMFGGYYQNTNTEAWSRTYFNASTPSFLNNYYYLQKGEAYSGFGQLLWKIIPTVEIAGGARFSDEKKQLPKVLTASGIGAPLLPVVTAKDHGHWTNVSPEATVTWRPTDRMTVFGSYKEGFLSGGFNAGAGGFTGDLSYNQQKIHGFETGIKSEIFDRRLFTSLALYTYKVTGLQVVTFPGGIVSVTTNAGKASVKGVDFETTYRTPIEGLTLRGAVDYLQGRYDVYTASCYTGQTQALGCNFGTPRMVANPAVPGTTKPIYSAQNLDGTKLTRSPNWTWNFGFNFERPITSNLKVGLSNDITYSGGYFTEPTSKPAGYQRHYTLVDGSIRIASIDDLWEVAVIGRNLTNKYYFVRSSDQTFTGSGTGDVVGKLADTAGNLNRGREIWLRFSAKFSR